MDNPRDIESSQYPKDGELQEKALFLINYAVLAPSSHNTQPWLFELNGDTIHLYADTQRSLPIVDPLNRELIISCGAALGQLQVAANFFGLSCNIDSFPNPEREDYLARIQLTEGHITTSNEIHLFLAIKDRFTSRQPFLPTPVPNSLITGMMKEAENTEIELQIISNPNLISDIANFVSTGDRQQFANPDFRKELSQWIRPRHSSEHDGMSSATKGTPDILSNMDAMVIRTFNVGNGVSATDKEIAEHSPLLAAIATKSDEFDDWLSCGVFLSRFLLLSASSGVNAGYLNQVTEVPELRASLRQLLDLSGKPQLLLRLGRAKPVKPSARRPLQDIVTVR